MIELDYLANHPQHAERLARLHFAQWCAMYRDWTPDLALFELLSHREGPAIPSTVVALELGVLLGSASLLHIDSDEIRDWTPWLASVYVLPEFRGCGIGRRLVERVVADAAALGVETLHLFTDDTQEWYRRMGWREHARRALGDTEVSIMCLDLKRASAAMRAPAAPTR